MAVPQTLSDWYTAKTSDVPAATGLLGTAAAPATTTPSTSVDPAAYSATKLSDPTTWNVTKEQTAQGQLGNIINQDSPLMQLAATKGAQQANSRGLLNSSMGIGATQDSVIAAATPIAQSDADVNARAAGYNADTSNTFSKTNVAIENDAKTFGAQAINRANEFNAGNEFTKQQAVFDANVKASLDQINNDAGFDRQSQQIFGSLSDTFSKQITAINQDNNMNQQSKDYSIKQLYDAYKAQISMLSAVGSIPDVSQLLIATPG